jgi:hypothetical protein
MRGKKRPLTERAQAVGIATITGIAEASRQTGIPENTIRDWFTSEEFAELRVRTKDQVAEEWWAGVQRGFRAVIKAFDGNDSIQQKATAAAILTDKLAMLRGEATVRTEHRALDDINDHEQRALSQAIDAFLAEHPSGAAEGDQGAVAVGEHPPPGADPA